MNRCHTCGVESDGGPSPCRCGMSKESCDRLDEAIRQQDEERRLARQKCNEEELFRSVQDELRRRALALTEKVPIDAPKKFWMVYRSAGSGPTRQHDTVDQARCEAARIARKQPGQDVWVLEAKSVCRLAEAPVTWEDAT